MTGVEILHSFEVVTEYGFDFAGFWIVMLLVALVALFCGAIIAYAGDDYPTGIFVAAMIIIFGGMISIAYNSDTVPVTSEARYMVTVSNEVSYEDFTKKYEVIEQTGKIYTVRERQN